jgi:hypothetical protein
MNYIIVAVSVAHELARTRSRCTAYATTVQSVRAILQQCVKVTCKSVSKPNSRLQSCFSLPTASPAGSFLSVGGLVQLPLATLISVTLC